MQNLKSNNTRFSYCCEGPEMTKADLVEDSVSFFSLIQTCQYSLKETSQYSLEDLYSFAI